MWSDVTFHVILRVLFPSLKSFQLPFFLSVLRNFCLDVSHMRTATASRALFADIIKVALRARHVSGEKSDILLFCSF